MPTPLRAALLVLPLAGAALLIAAELSTLYEIAGGCSALVGAALILVASSRTTLDDTAGSERVDRRRRQGRRGWDSAPARTTPEDTAAGDENAPRYQR